jgi:Tol biopolymer transport system component
VTRTSAMTNWPALSSDARLIAYVSDAGQDGTTPQIWIHQIGGASLRLTNGDHEYSHLSFSPDNTRIVFTATDEAGPNVYDVPTLGGEPRLLQRGASFGQTSPNGAWFAFVPRDAASIRVAANGGSSFRTIARELIDVACFAWLPDSRSVIVHARRDEAFEADWWVVPVEGGSPTNIGLVQQLREKGMFTVPTGAAWVNDSLVFSGAGPQGVCLYRQRFILPAVELSGSPERLTEGIESAWLPAAATGRIAFISSRADTNLWSVALESASGIAHGALRRMTRGPGILGYLSVTTDDQTLAYFSFRLGDGHVFLKDLRTDAERVMSEGPVGPKCYPAISPGGSQLAYGLRMVGGERALRPIFIVSLRDGTWRSLGEDCGGRPREWVDERRLIIERFARLNSIALIDANTGSQIDLLSSPEWSIRNPRLSPDRRWITFEASRAGQPANVYVAPFGERRLAESEWETVARLASHPFWSADGRLLYYTPTGVNPLVRSAIHARGFGSDTGRAQGEPIAAYASSEMVIPAYLPGTAPLATKDQILLVLGDFRGDVWLMDVDSC